MARSRPVQRMIVREDRPLRRRLLAVGALLLVIVVAGAGWLLGRWSVVDDLVGAAGAGPDDVITFDQLLADNRSMREELAIYRNGGDVSRQVEQRVQEENRVLQDRVAELDQAVAAYRRVLSADRAGKGLKIERMDVQPSTGPGVWQLSMQLVRVGEKDAVAEGRLEGRVVVEGAAGRTELALPAVAGHEATAFRVRYVEDVSVVLNLPPGTVPVRVDAVLVLSAPRPERVEKSWQRQVTRKQEVPVNAGQG